MTHDRITCDPTVMSGQPVIKGTRVPVSVLLWMLAGGETTETVLANYPNISADDLKAALAFAAETLESPHLVAAE